MKCVGVVASPFEALDAGEHGFQVVGAQRTHKLLVLIFIHGLRIVISSANRKRKPSFAFWIGLMEVMDGFEKLKDWS